MSRDLRRTTRRLLTLSILATIAVLTGQRVMAAPARHAHAPEVAAQSLPPVLADSPLDLQLESEPGAIEVVRERYPDGRIKVQREVTLDAKGNYVNHGSWKMWDSAGNPTAEGQYESGQRVGAWTRWHRRRDSNVLNAFPFNRFQPPFMSHVTFTNGVMDGDWSVTDGDKNRCQLISLKMGRRDGPTITWLPNGSIYRQWTYENDVPVGEVLQVNDNGELQRAETYLDGRRVVQNTSFHSQRNRRKKLEEEYLAPKTVLDNPDEFWTMRFATYKPEGESLRHGVSKAWYANGSPQHEGAYEYGEKVGRFSYWFANGQLALTAEYRNDRKHGLWVWWHENGQKSDHGEYDDDARVGVWRKWDASGKLTQVKTFEGEDRRSVDSNNEDQDYETAERGPTLTPAPQQMSLPEFLR